MHFLELPEAPTATAALSVEAAYQSIMGLHRFILVDTVHQSTVDNSIPVDPRQFEVPDELEGEDEIDRINNAGTSLVHGLSDPRTVHTALDSLLALEVLRKADSRLGRDIAKPGQELDEHGSEYLDAVFNGEDGLAIVKAARLVISRASAGYDGQDNLTTYLPQIVTLMDPKSDGATTESKHLRKDLEEALVQAHSEPYYNGNGGQLLFNAFQKGLGYTHNLHVDWENNGNDRRMWAKANIDNILLLEKREPGLSRKITETFNITNFARYDQKMLADMYYSRLTEPAKPYVLSFRARDDHNLAFSRPKATKKLYDQLAAQGIHYEEYECSGTRDIKQVIDEARELHQLHGSEVTDVIINAHGTATTLSLSNDFDGLVDSSKELDFLGELTPVLRDDARLIMLSCSAGKAESSKRCIAEEMAQMLGREAVASNVNTEAKAKLKTKAGQPRIEAEFSGTIYNVLASAPLVLIPTGTLFLEPNLYGLPFLVGGPVGFFLMPKLSAAVASLRNRRTFSP